MWNETDEPLAILITFRTYGTWLPGDERGTVNRFQNRYGTDKISHVPDWVEKNRSGMKAAPVILSPRQRATVRRAITETCDIRGWKVYAINIRTNHVHVVVVGAGQRGPIVINALKANATRMLRARKLWASERSPWSDK